MTASEAFESIPHHMRLYFDSVSRELAKAGYVIAKRTGDVVAQEDGEWYATHVSTDLRSNVRLAPVPEMVTISISEVPVDKPYATVDGLAHGGSMTNTPATSAHPIPTICADGVEPTIPGFYVRNDSPNGFGSTWTGPFQDAVGAARYWEATDVYDGECIVIIGAPKDGSALTPLGGV